MNKQNIDIEAEREALSIKKMNSYRTDNRKSSQKRNKCFIPLSSDRLWDYLLSRTIKGERE